MRRCKSVTPRNVVLGFGLNLCVGIDDRIYLDEAGAAVNRCPFDGDFSERPLRFTKTSVAVFSALSTSIGKD